MKLSSILRTAAAIALLCLVSPLSAQFNGPGPTTSSLFNQPVPLTENQSVLNPSPRNPILMQGDVISIHLFGQSEYSPTVTIGTDGKVMLPLIGVVTLDHLTVTAAEEVIATRLSEAGMYQNPQVTISVESGPSSSVTLIGEVHGVIPVVGTRRLLDILAAAGGLPPTASHVITINRPGVPHPIVVQLGTDPSTSAAADIPIFPGDTIVIARVGVIYLLGSFKTSGVIPLSSNLPLTLLEAISLGGGAAPDAKLNDLRIIRTVGNKRTMVKIDMKRVEYGKDPDPFLQPNDILFLPNSFFKSLLTNGSIGTLFGVISIILTAYAYIHD